MTHSFPLESMTPDSPSFPPSLLAASQSPSEPPSHIKFKMSKRRGKKKKSLDLKSLDFSLQAFPSATVSHKSKWHQCYGTFSVRALSRPEDHPTLIM